MKKLIKVVGAIIENQNSEILCDIRSTWMTLHNLWEYPGGKGQKDEEIGDAIVRGIEEELGYDIEFKEVLHDNTHEYDGLIKKF